MKIRMILNNFQQTKFADITFEEGLTIIKGTNNQGKSSLRRAFEAVIFNNPRKTKNYIMNGTKSCSVEIQVEGYKPILWKKTTKECSYKIGDKPYEKAGRMCLKDVYPDHPFTLFGDNLLFNVIKQGSTPIPFGQPSSQVFNIFEELYGILSTKEDISKFNTKLSEYNTQIVQNTRQIEKFKTKLSVIKDFKKHTDIEKLHKLKDKLQKANSFLDKASKIKEYKSSIDTYSVTPIPVSSDKLNKQITVLRKIKEIKALHKSIESRIQLEPPIDTSIFEEYNKIKAFMDLVAERDSIEAKRAELRKEIENIKSLIPVCPTCKKPL